MVANLTAVSRFLSNEKRVDLHDMYSTYVECRKTEATGLLPFQNKIRAAYECWYVQLSIAIIILVNFLINAIDAQCLPVKGKDDRAIAIFAGFEFFFSYVYLTEFLVNFYGSFFFEFWKCGWNIFDLLVVVGSLISVHIVSVLRLIRAFRAVRLFRRFTTLRKLSGCIMNSFPAVTTAFGVLLLIIGIYAILGVEIFKEFYSDEFGDFLSATLSLLQILAFDS